jgi:hypothetical protein
MLAIFESAHHNCCHTGLLVGNEKIKEIKRGSSVDEVDKPTLLYTTRIIGFGSFSPKARENERQTNRF